MATLTNEQIAEKKLLLKQLSQQANAIIAELTEAGAWPLSDDELDEANGGASSAHYVKLPQSRNY